TPLPSQQRSSKQSSHESKRQALHTAQHSIPSEQIRRRARKQVREALHLRSTSTIRTSTCSKSERMSASRELHSVRGTSAPNPSIEGTSTSKLRLLAAAPHVKR